jgi:hypothetical protein
VLLALIEERIEDQEHRLASWRFRLFPPSGHEVVIAAECLITAGPEVDLTTLDLDIDEFLL